jgi:hypothetical protein
VTSAIRANAQRDMGESVTMNLLDPFYFFCMAVVLFLLARKNEDKVGRTLGFVLAGLNLILLVRRLFT